MANLIWLFLKLGVTSFGGPAAHIAMMEEEFVHRRQWITREKFLELMALTNVIPGPNSTELAIHIGFIRAGWWGFWVAGLSFILPAFLIVTLVAAFYVKYSALPQVHDFLSGVQVAVVAVIILAFERFLKSMFAIKSLSAMKDKLFWQDKRNATLFFILIISCFLKFKGLSEIPILLNGAMISYFLFNRLHPWSKAELSSLFWVFFKIGSLLFGSGYVLLSFLQTEFITHRQWISHTQLLDAISVGQFTPGPVFTTVSFIGYLMNGIPGAIIATIGIFLPAFIFVALSIPLYKKLQSSPLFKTLLDGIVAASMGLLLSTLWTLSWDSLTSPLLIGLFTVSFIVTWRQYAPTAVVIFVAGAISLFALKI